jgi:hypothetical protein
MFRTRQEYSKKLQVPKHLYLQMNSDGVQISPGDNSIKIKNQTIKIRPKTHANKNKPTDGLKFSPKYEVIWEPPKTFSNTKPQPNIGHQRIMEKQWQDAHLSDLII